MFSSSAFLLLSLANLWIFLSASADPCPDQPVFTPSSLVVRSGHPASAVCSVCADCIRFHFDLEYSVGTRKKNGTKIFWDVDKLKEWDLALMCFYNFYDSSNKLHQCIAYLSVTLYQPPEDVSIRFVHGNRRLLAGQTYTLECAVQKVAPLKNLTVTFYKGLEPLAERTSTRGDTKPADETFTLSFNASEEDDGAEYWCQARLDLTVQPVPPAGSSPNITASVQYKPRLTSPSSPDPVEVVQGEPLELNCSAVGNPRPSYTWTRLGNARSLSNASVYSKESVSVEDKGLYTCTVTNSMGTASVLFNVEVKVDVVGYIIAGVIGALLLLSIIGYVCYSIYYKHNYTGRYSLKKSISCCRTHTPVSTSA